MKIVTLILMAGISLFIISCGESSANDWPASVKSQMLNDCMESDETSEEYCQCMIDATISEFSYNEFESLKTATEDEISDDLKERSINLMMTMMECAL